MQKRGIELISQLFFYLVVFITETYLIMGNTSLPYGGMILIIGIAILNAELRKRIDEHGWFFILTLLALGAVIYVNSRTVEIPALHEIAIIIAVWSVLIRGFEKHINLEKPNYFLLAIMTICYVVVDVMDYKQGSPLVFLLTFIYLLLHIYYSNLDNVEAYMDARKETTVMANGYMKQITKKLTMIYVAVAGVVLFIVTRWSYGRLYQWLKVGLRNMIMELLRLAGLLSFESTKYQPKVQPTPEIPFSTSRPDRAAREMPYSIKMICIALLAVMIIAFIILFIYMTYKLMKKKRIKKKVEVEEVIETREKVEKVKRKAHKKNSLHGKDPAVMIRKLYRKHMHGFWVSTSVTKGDKTPSEQRILKNESGGNIPEEAIAIYEKIRYSDQEVTQQDVHALKQLFK